MIVNKTKGFYFADITVKSEHTDRDGDTYDVVEYAGSLAKMYIKDINCSIYLGGMRTKLFSNNEYKKIKFENDEFNNFGVNVFISSKLFNKLSLIKLISIFVNLESIIL